MQRVNSDLMVAELQKRGIRADLPQIAIIDGAINPRAFQYGGRVVVGNVWSADKVRSSAEEYLGHMHHAVELVQTILAIAPGSRIRSWQAFDGPVGNTGNIVTMIRKACELGDLVISLSASAGGVPIQAAFPELREEIESKGCVLIEASGNSGSGGSTYANNGQLFLTVGAIDKQGKTPDYSTPAPLNAPGVDWNLTDSLGVDHLKSGTSYAAPVVSAIAKYVYAQLAQATDYSAVSGRQRAMAVRLILRESSLSGQVDGYRAVLLARHVAVNGINQYVNLGPFKSENYTEQAMLASLVEKPREKFCAKISAVDQCEALVACYDQKRRYLASHWSSATAFDFRDLEDTALRAGEPDLAVEWKARRAQLEKTGNSASSSPTARQVEPTIPPPAPPPINPLTYKVRDNRDLYGNDIVVIRDSKQSDCELACSANAQCEGYSYNKWRGSCFLKADLGESRQEAAAISAVKNASQFPQAVRTESTTSLYRNRSFSGSGIGDYRTGSSEVCQSTCSSNASCVAYNYSNLLGVCRLFSSVESMSQPNKGVDSGSKSQPYARQ